MEILGRNIPTLQTAISSGLESVSAGILESVKKSGGVALGIAQDSFSFEQVATATADLPAASGVAEYLRPDQYFRRFPGTTSDSPVSSLALSKTLSDPNFNAPKSLQTFSNSSGSMVENALKAFRAWYEQNKDNLFDDVGMQDLLGDIYGAGSPDREGRWLVRTGTHPADDRYGRETAEGTSFGDVGYDPSYPATDRFGGDTVQGTSAQGATASGFSDGSSDRAIIVVGGKTSGTYFQTIDDSVTQLQTNPTQETANLFGQQYNAVTDMISTVSRTADLQQSLTLNQFTALR